MIAWIKRHVRGTVLFALLGAVAVVATGFSGSPQGGTLSFTAPTNVAATSEGEKITVSWTPGAGAASQVIVAVNVLDDTDYCLGFDATGSAASHDCPDLTIGATYVVLVIALDGAGDYRLGKDDQGNLVTHLHVSGGMVSREVGAGEAVMLTHESGAQIEVPAGALPEATTVSITEADAPESNVAAGMVFDFSASGAELEEPVSVTIPYELSEGKAHSDVLPIHWNEQERRWESMDNGVVDPARQTVTVETSELSLFSTAELQFLGEWLAEAAALLTIPGYNPRDNIVSEALRELVYEGSNTKVLVALKVGESVPKFNAEVTYIIDLFDMMGITEEGRDGWVTGWVNTTLGLGGLSWGSKTPIGVTMFAHSTSGDADPRFKATFKPFTASGLANNRAVSIKVFPQKAGKFKPPGLDDVDWEICLSCSQQDAKFGISWVDLTFNSLKAEFRLGLHNVLSDYFHAKLPLGGNSNEDLEAEAIAENLISAMFERGDPNGIPIRAVEAISSEAVAPFTSFDAPSPSEIRKWDQSLHNQILSHCGGIDAVTGEKGCIEGGDMIFASNVDLDGPVLDTPLRLQVRGDLRETRDYKLELLDITDGWDMEVDRGHEGLLHFVSSTLFKHSARFEMRADPYGSTVHTVQWLVGRTPDASEDGMATFALRHERGFRRDELLDLYRVEMYGHRDTSDAAVSVSSSVDSVSPGGSVTYTATVTNNGPDRTGGTSLHIHNADPFGNETDVTGWALGSARSTGSTPECESESEGAKFVCALGDLADGETVVVTLNMTAPDLFPDTLTSDDYPDPEQFVDFKVSAQVYDRDDTNDEVTVTLAVTETQSIIDLVLDSPPAVSDVSVDSGESFTLSVTVRNRGNSRSGQSTLRYYRSVDPTISTGDTEAGTDRVNSLDPSERGDESARLAAPSVAGDYYYGACVDSVSDESDTQNNCSTGALVTVSRSNPDLVVESSEVSEDSVDTGESFTFSVTVRNRGNGESDLSKLRYYRSSNTTISTGDTEAGTDRVNSLDPSETADEEITLTAPATAGTYYYGACVDSVPVESNRRNNCSSAVTVTVTQNNPDLVMESPSVSDTSLEAGESFTFSATVRNQGNSTSEATTLRYYRSSDSTISTDDTEEGTDNVPAIGASGTADATTDLTAPSVAGTYYYGACVDSVSGESDASNNCSDAEVAYVGGSPDLTATAFSGDLTALSPGETFNLTVWVANDGTQASPTTTIRFYRSADSTISSADMELFMYGVRSLGPGLSQGYQINPNAPATPGTYYYGACLDAVADESNTQNNCSAALTATVSQGNGGPVTTGNPDLVVSLSVNDAAPETGESFTLSAAVENQGDGTSAATILRHYSSTDSIISTDDTELASGVVAGIGPSEAAGAAIDRTAPATAGTYYYGACVDAVPGESNTENNCSPAVTVTVSQGSDGPVTPGNPDLVVDSPVLGVPDPPGILATGGSFLLLTTVRNQGSGTSAATTLRYYRSADSTISTDDTEEGTANVSALDASGTEGQTIDLTAPATAGTYYYGACVDAVFHESNTQNNCSGAVAATVTEPTETEVDVSVSSPSVSRSEVGPGGRFSLHVTVGITGVDEPYYIVPLSYHRSGDSSISDSDAWIRSETLSLGPPSYGERTGIILYAADDFGVSYYGACVYYSDPDETNTQNNCSAGVAVTVTESIQTIQDLKIGNSPTVTDSNPAPGGRFTLSVAVRNTGDAATPGTTSRYYRSSDSTITSGDTEVGTSTVNRLLPGQSVLGAITLTAPSDAGTYYYGACVDSVARESDTTNNCSSGVEVTVSAPTSPDLEVGGESVSDREVNTGGSFTLEVTVYNNGDGASPATTLRYYRSTDSTISTSDTQVDTDTVSALDPDDDDEESESLTAPSTAGVYYYGACVDSVAGESDTTNNCSDGEVVYVGGSPDLTVSVTGSDLTLSPGASFSFQVYVHNSGTKTSSATTARFYRSTDATISTADTQLTTSSLPTRGQGQRYTVDTTAPSSTGIYYFGACVDSVSGESDTSNNCSAGGRKVTVQ